MNSSMYRPKVFIGSSRETIDFARAIHSHRSINCDVNVWYGNTFTGNEYTMQSLENELKSNDFAIFIFAPDDVAIIRGKPVYTTRDNTVFEMGLFNGRLGRERVFAVIPDSVVNETEMINGKEVKEYHLLSDFDGITPFRYENQRADSRFKNDTEVACGDIYMIIKKLGRFIAPENSLQELMNKFDKNYIFLIVFIKILILSLAKKALIYETKLLQIMLLRHLILRIIFK